MSRNGQREEKVQTECGMDEGEGENKGEDCGEGLGLVVRAAVLHLELEGRRGIRCPSRLLLTLHLATAGV